MNALQGSAALAPNRVISGRYRLERLIGEGGMGAVWAARVMSTGQIVAIKFVKDEHRSNERQRRFTREARAAMAIAHPNVVRIRDVHSEGCDGVPPFMVMDLLVGESLDRRLARTGIVPLEAFLTVFLPIVSAVGTAHAMGIVHRDLKPENIFLCASEPRSLDDVPRAADVRVLDFGIAKLTAGDGSSVSNSALTESGDRLGTPRYMSPEQVYGERDIDHRTDVWSLGIVLYECLTGEHPVRAANIGQMFKTITNASFEPLATIAPHLPTEITALCARMLSKDRLQRPQDLREVLSVLRGHSRVDVPDFDAAILRPGTDDSEWRGADTLDDSAEEHVPKQRARAAEIDTPLIVRRPPRLETEGVSAWRAGNALPLLGVVMVVAAIGVGVFVWIGRPKTSNPSPVPALSATAAGESSSATTNVGAKTSANAAASAKPTASASTITTSIASTVPP